MKTFLATASLLALLAAAPVQAQTTPTQPTETKPGATQPTPPPADVTKPATPPSATAPAPTTDAAKKMDMPKSASAGSDWRASKLIGQTIRNAANESIGDINDLMVDTSGKVTAVIVGVGGFLGIGEKSVSMPFDKLSFSRDANNAVTVTASATKESLQSAPEYQFPDERAARSTPGTGGSPTAPAPGTSR